MASVSELNASKSVQTIISFSYGAFRLNPICNLPTELPCTIYRENLTSSCFCLSLEGRAACMPEMTTLFKSILLFKVY